MTVPFLFHTLFNSSWYIPCTRASALIFLQLLATDKTKNMTFWSKHHAKGIIQFFIQICFNFVIVCLLLLPSLPLFGLSSEFYGRSVNLKRDFIDHPNEFRRLHAGGLYFSRVLFSCYADRYELTPEQIVNVVWKFSQWWNNEENEVTLWFHRSCDVKVWLYRVMLPAFIECVVFWDPILPRNRTYIVVIFWQKKKNSEFF